MLLILVMWQHMFSMPVMLTVWRRELDYPLTTLTEVFLCFFLSCKANARVKLTSRGMVRTLQK